MLDTPLAKQLKPAEAKKFADLGLVSVGDLLRHYPRRYEKWGELTPLAGLVPGEQVSVLVEVRSAVTIPMRQRRGDLLKLVVTDGDDDLDVTFFNAPAFMKANLRKGRQLLLSGSVETY